jgi:hypothetical protein
MAKRKARPARLNIYLHDPAIRRQVKMTAARQDLSVSEYCLRAITTQLGKDGEIPPEGDRSDLLAAAVENARRFQVQTFRGKVLRVSSADLIREARSNANRR